jgi:hypothetical protein
MTLVPPPPPSVPKDYGDRIVAHWQCDMRQAGAIDALERGRMRILYVLIATGLALMFGLAIYGIKMTHRVAGPLFKVSLYLAKMRDGRFDKVYNLRKGDQLVDFFDHFKHAHDALRQRTEEDIALLDKAIAAAGTSPVADELKAAKQRKEESLK